MRVGFVIPWIQRAGGNKTVFSVARGLAEIGHPAHLFCHTVRADLVPEIERQLGGARLSYLVRSEAPYEGHRDDLAWQLASGKYRTLAGAIAAAHRESPFDALVVVANEGRGLAHHLRAALADPRPLLGWSVMELIDHSFLLRRERDHRPLRTLLSPAYPLVHWLWSQSMLEYDFLCANSAWTAGLVEYLYGLRCGHLLISIPEEAFGPLPPPEQAGAGPYVAAPTVSLGPRERQLLSEVAASGIRLVTFGPNPVPGAEDLGYLSEARLREVFAGAAATLFLFEYEALGLIPFESLAVGTPVVTLPKYGVGAQWRSCRHVDFATTGQGLVDACRQRLADPPTEERRKDARAVVEPFRGPRAAESLLRFLEEVHRESRGP